MLRLESAFAWLSSEDAIERASPDLPRGGEGFGGVGDSEGEEIGFERGDAVEAPSGVG
jgi:hypothetical protein